MELQKTDEGERLVKLALFIKEHAPVDFASIRAGLPEYAYYSGDDADAGKRHDQKVRRMFERDKTSLERYGIYLHVDSYSNYSIDTNASYAAPVELTEQQASLLRLMCAALLEDESYPLKEELRMVLAKIGDELDVPDMLPQLQPAAPQRKRRASELSKVQTAIAKRKRLSFEYHNAAGKHSQREVEPFGAFFLNKHCYIAAFDPDAGSAGEERLFRLDRMEHLRVHAAQSAKPDFESHPFNVQQWLRLPFQFGEDSFTATVRFDTSTAWRAQSLCMEKGTFEECGDELLWHVECNDARRLAAWCIEHGPGVVPEHPERALAAYRNCLEAALEVHGEQ